MSLLRGCQWALELHMDWGFWGKNEKNKLQDWKQPWQLDGNIAAMGQIMNLHARISCLPNREQCNIYIFHEDLNSQSWSSLTLTNYSKLLMSYVEEQCLRSTFLLWLPSSLPGVFADSTDAGFLWLIYYTPNRCMSALQWKRSFGGLHLQSKCKGIQQEQSSHYKAHCHYWPENQRHFYAGLQCIILCQRIGLIGTKPDTFVAKKKKMPRLGGPKMWDHVNRPPVGLSLLFQYHSCQGPCTRWHSLSRERRCFNSASAKKKKKTNTRRRGSGRFQRWQTQKSEGFQNALSIVGRQSIQMGTFRGNLGTSDRHS